MANGANPERLQQLARILQELSDLVRLVRDCESKTLVSTVSFVDVHKKLLEIKKQMDVLQENYKKNLALFGLTPADLIPTEEQIARLNPQEKKMYKQLKELQTTCEKARDSAYKALQQDPDTVRRVLDDLKNKEGKSNRKSKFKSIGGKKGWMPT
jgi:hypothetical protein